MTMSAPKPPGDRLESGGQDRFLTRLPFDARGRLRHTRGRRRRDDVFSIGPSAGAVSGGKPHLT